MGVAAFSRHGTPLRKALKNYNLWGAYCSIFRLYELYLGLYFSVSQPSSMLTALPKTCLDPLTAHSWLLQCAALLVTLTPFLDSSIASCTTALKPSHYRYFMPSLVQKPCIYQTPAHSWTATCKSAVIASYPLPRPSKGLQKVERQTQQNTLAMLRSSLYFGRGTVLHFSLKVSSRKATIFSSKQRSLVYQNYQMCSSAAALASHCPTADEQRADATSSGNAVSY